MQVRYRFRHENGPERIVAVMLDDLRLEALDPLPRDLPGWTELAFCQCPHCPLRVEDSPHCPLAVRLSQVVPALGDVLSHERVEVVVETAEREIRVATTAQRGASALLGLVTATSGCPHTVYLKPMARFHLPFASEEETVYRAVSMYLLARYFQHVDGQPADFRLDGLTTVYRNLQGVNAAMAQRLRAVLQAGDAAVNAIILLDLFAKALPAVIADSVDEVRYLFADYLARPPA
jgi:hypothetical protein